jgi:hypothetical protein
VASPFELAATRRPTATPTLPPLVATSRRRSRTQPSAAFLAGPVVRASAPRDRRSFLGQLGDVFTGVGPGIANLVRSAAVGAAAPLRAGIDWSQGEISATDALLAGTPIGDIAGFLGNDRAQELGERYRPIGQQMGQSVKDTAGRVRHPSRYVDAWNEGRIVNTVLEDAGNAALVGGLASKAFGAGAVSAEAAGNAARAGQFRRASDIAARVAGPLDAISDAGISVPRAVLKRGVSRGDRMLAGWRAAPAGTTRSRAVQTIDRRFPTVASATGRRIGAAVRNHYRTQQRARTEQIRDIKTAVDADNLSVAEQGAAIASRVGADVQLERAGRAVLPASVFGVPPEMGVAVPPGRVAPMLGLGDGRRAIVPRDIPELTMTADVADVAMARRAGMLDPERAAAIKTYETVVDQQLESQQQAALAGTGRIRGPLDADQLGDAPIPAYVDKAMRETNPQSFGLGVPMDGRWVPLNDLVARAETDPVVAEMIADVMDSEGLAGFVVPSERGLLEQVLNNPNVYPAAWRPAMEMAARARAAIGDRNVSPLTAWLERTRSARATTNTRRKTARQQIADLKASIQQQIDEMVGSGDPLARDVQARIVELDRQIGRLAKELRSKIKARRETAGRRRGQGDTPSMLSSRQRTTGGPWRDVEPGDMGTREIDVEVLQRQIEALQLQADQLRAERDALLEPEVAADVAALEDGLGELDGELGDAGNLLDPENDPTYVAAKRRPKKSAYQAALETRRRVLDNIARSQRAREARLGATIRNVRRADAPLIGSQVPLRPADQLATGSTRPGYVPAGNSELVNPTRAGTGRVPIREGIRGYGNVGSENMRGSSELLAYSGRALADQIGDEAAETARNVDVARIFRESNVDTTSTMLGNGTLAALRRQAEFDTATMSGTPADVERRYGQLITERLAELGYEPLPGDLDNPKVGDFDPNPKVPYERVNERTVVLPVGLKDRLIPYVRGKDMGRVMAAIAKTNQKFKGAVLPFSVRWQLGDAVGGMYMAWAGGGVNPAEMFSAMRDLKQLTPDDVRRLFDGLQDSGLNLEQARWMDGSNLETPSTATGRAWRRAGDVRRASYRLNEWINRMNRQGFTLAKLQRLLNERGLSLDDPTTGTRNWDDADVQQAIHDAVEEANRVMGTFDDMTPFERNYIRNIFPFYTWNRHITKLAWQTAIDHPSRMMWTMWLGAHGAETNEGYDLLPWQAGSIVAGDTLIPTNFVNPMNDVGGGSMFTPAGALRSMSPVIKVAAAAVGKDANRGLADITRPFDGGGLDALGRAGGFRFAGPTELAYQIVRQVPQGRALLNVLPTGEIGNVGVGPHPRFGSGEFMVDRAGNLRDTSSRWQELWRLIGLAGDSGSAMPLLGSLENNEDIIAARDRRFRDAQRQAANTVRFEP